MSDFFKVDGRPTFLLGGQSHNSSTGNPDDLNLFFKALDALNANTAEIPVYWASVEPAEGCYDFSSVDNLLELARTHDKYLVLLWFATWKNGNMRYAPSWVKQDVSRFHRVVSHEGNHLFVLSSHCEANLAADKAAFCALLAHIKSADTDRRVAAVQIQNEAGIAGRSYRDFGEQGERDYHTPVPALIIDAIKNAPGTPLWGQWAAKGFQRGKDWGETFGVKNGAENMTAYSVARYINAIAVAGKAVHDIPFFTNVALDRNPWGFNLAGTNYTAGGPIPRLYEIWKAAAPALVTLAPDIYFQCTSMYKSICARYSNEQNALFIPESASGGAHANYKNMFYAIGEYGAVGYAPFGIESILDKEGNVDPSSQDLVDSFRSVSHALPLITKYRGTGRVHTVVQEPYEQGYFYETDKYIVKVDYDKTVSTNYIHRALKHAPSTGRGLIIEASSDEFYLLGANFTVYFAPKDDIFYSEDRVSNHMPYLFIEEGRFDPDGKWHKLRTRTGDECDHGVWVFPENAVVHVVLCP